jgi:diazepam-binding inhibitor (GABA receptor modulating acyl-CoA-binding protein)
MLWELQGKAKKNAWQRVVDEGITKEEAQERYIKLVETLKEKYGYDADKVPEAVGAA